MYLARSTLLVSVLLSLALTLAGCGGGRSASTTGGHDASDGRLPSAESAGHAAPAAVKSPAVPPKPVDPIVVLRTTAGDVKIHLFAQKAPQTVDNFLTNYVTRGFYNQTIFHHVEPGMMLIAGGYTADLQPKPARTPIFNESRNGLSNRRGTVAMIRQPDSPHTATSQFFINLAENPDLDFKEGETEDVLGYCVFGEVIEGLDVVDRIAQMPTAALGEFASVPSPAVAIESIERLR
jgi:peptidyl-prolyl cis-trans isomerase A (cyclophilin A)